MAKYSSLTIVLDKDLDEENLLPLMAAINQLRGVLSVKGGPVDILAEYIASERIRRELGDKLFAVVFPQSKDS